jgi:hypothetical protein
MQEDGKTSLVPAGLLQEDKLRSCLRTSRHGHEFYMEWDIIPLPFEADGIWRNQHMCPLKPQKA